MKGFVDFSYMPLSTDSAFFPSFIFTTASQDFEDLIKWA